MLLAPPPPFDYVCADCRHEFTQYGTLKMFLCNLQVCKECNKVFKHEFTLKAHMKEIHSGMEFNSKNAHLFID